MNIPSIILLSLFGIASIIHLVFCFLEKDKIRQISKPICLLVLSISAVIALPGHPFIYVGAFLSFVGDILLLRPKENKMFILGTFFFMLAHFLYFGEVCLIISTRYQIPIWLYFVYLAGLVLFALIAYPKTTKIAGKSGILGGAYLPNLVFMIVVGVQLFIFTKFHWSAFLLILGYFFFLVSDLLLTYMTFTKDIKRSNFYIMITYLLGEFLIVFGLINVIISL